MLQLNSSCPKRHFQILKGILQGSEEEISIEYNETNAQFTFGATLT